MNPAPEDPLARMARWEALRRRVDGRAAPGDRSGQVAPGEGGGQVAPGEGGGQVAPGDRGGQVAPGDRGGQAPGERTASPIDELAAATRRVVEQDPSASIMITVRSAGGTSSVRVSQVDGEVVVTATGAEPPAAPRELPPGDRHTGSLFAGSPSAGSPSAGYPSAGYPFAGYPFAGHPPAGHRAAEHGTEPVEHRTEPVEHRTEPVEPAEPAEPAGADRSSQIIAELADLLRQDPSFLSRPG